MATERAWVAVTASGVDGPQAIKSGRRIAGVNRNGAGNYYVHLADDIVNPSGHMCVLPTINAGDFTHRYIDYEVVAGSRRQVNIHIENTFNVGVDVDFSVEIVSDSDASIGA